MKIKLDKGAYMPERAHESDAGLDLRSPIDIYVPPKGFALIDSGVHIQLPLGTVGFLKSKSGFNIKHGITSEGVIDAGYTGSIRVKLDNGWNIGYHVRRGDKISQLVVLPLADVGCLEQVDELDASERGDGGFGSTGK